MKKYACFVVTFFVCVIVFMFPFNAANAQESESYKLACCKGMLFTTEYSLSAGKAIDVFDVCFELCPASYAVLQNNNGIVNVAESTLIDIKDGSIYVKEGIIAIDAINGDVYAETGTEKVQVKKGSRLTVRVDDYGNAFNYCTNGSAILYSKLNDKEMTLNSGEYIAVTVKRGFRILKETNNEEVEALGIVFATEDEVNSIEYSDFCAIDNIVGDFSQDGDIAKVVSNRVYFLTAQEGTTVSLHTLYLECDNEEAILCVYDKELNIVASSLDEKLANKPNVTVKTENSDGYIVCIYSDKDTEYFFKQVKYESTVDKVIAMLKRIALPACVALVLFAIYGVVETKIKKKPKF